MSAGGDETRAMRPGEEIDAAKLGAYLDTMLGGHADVSITQFPGGHSNLTYLVVRGDDEYVLRRPPFGSKVKTAHDMGREFRILSQLAAVYPKAPRPVLSCEDEAVIGARFYLMERRRGVILRKELPRGMTIDAATARGLCELLVDALVELHAIDYVAAGLGDFGKPAGYVERQVRGWTERYGGSQTDDIPAVTEVAAYFVVGSMAADEAGVTIDCATGPKVTRWTVEKDGTRIEDSAAISPGTFDDVFRRIDSIGWKNLGDCPPEGGADVPVYTFDLADWNGTASFQCDALNPPYPYNTITDELDQLAATIRGDRGKNTLEVDDSDLQEKP